MAGSSEKAWIVGAGADRSGAKAKRSGPNPGGRPLSLLAHLNKSGAQMVVFHETWELVIPGQNLK